jgi:hypothetical protein
VDVVLHCMDLGNIEMRSDLLANKLVLVCVKAVPCVFDPSEGMVGMSLEVGVMDEVEDSTSRSHDFWVGCASNDSKEHLLHVLALVAGPLRDEKDSFLEMAKAWMPGHCLEASIDLVFTTSKRFGDPLDDVILEDTLV